MPGGYLSAFPESLFDRFEAVQPVWAPYYTLHKVLVGLLDQFEIAGSGLAYDLASRLAAYVGNRLEAVLRRRAARRVVRHSSVQQCTVEHTVVPVCGAHMRHKSAECAPHSVHHARCMWVSVSRPQPTGTGCSTTGARSTWSMVA